MPRSARDAVTAALNSTSVSDRERVDDMVRLVYDELRAMAHTQLARERRAPLNTTGLVHEAYLRLVDRVQVPAGNRAYFFGAAARAMRQVLVDAARQRGRQKHGAGQEPLDVDGLELAAEGLAAELVDLDEALRSLAELYPRQADVVECRFFGGLSVEETAQALALAPRTVKRHWALARAWLHRELQAGGSQRERSERT